VSIHDVPDEPLLDDLVLAPLLRGLTAGPAPGELAGQDAALEMYRAAYAAGPNAARSRGLVRGAGRLIGDTGGRARGAGRQVRGVRLAAVALAVLAGGVIAAHLLFGLPGARRDTTARVPRHPAHAVSPGRSDRGGPSIMTVPPDDEYRSLFEMGMQLVAWSVPDGEVVAGRPMVITANLTNHHRAVQGTELGLFERAAGQRRWRLVTLARTGARGTAMLRVRGLTTNARFRVKDAGKDVSKPLSIVVVPPVTLRLHVGKHGKHGKRDVLLVRCRFAVGGDVVRLEVRRGSGWHHGDGPPGHWHHGHWHHGDGPGNARAAGGRAGHPADGRPDGTWQTVGMGRLGNNGTVSFEIAGPEAGLVYRVVLLATAAHGQSLSNVVVITVRDLRWKP
jgi:hypothetical protein